VIRFFHAIFFRFTDRLTADARSTCDLYERLRFFLQGPQRSIAMSGHQRVDIFLSFFMVM
jgi:hypothetical protein